MAKKSNGDGRISYESLEWLSYMHNNPALKINENEYVKIQNGFTGEEKYFINIEFEENTRIYIDGYAEVNGRTIGFEYLGCQFHPCQTCWETHKRKGYIYKTKAEFTNAIKIQEKRLNFLKTQLDELFTITSCEWTEKKKKFKGENLFSRFMNKKEINKSELYSALLDKKGFYLLKASMHLPEEYQERWLALNHPPIYDHMELYEDHLSEYMKKMAKKEDKRFPLPKQLILRFACENYVLTSSLFQFYMSIGFQVTNIDWAIEYTGRRILKPFIENITKDRINATIENNDSKQMLAKLIANSWYEKIREKININFIF